MDKKRELAKNTVILTVGKICTQFVSFMLLPLYTALLSTEEYGVIDLFNTYILLLVPIFNWQFENGLFRFMLDCRNHFSKTKKLFSTVFVANLIQIIAYLVFYMIAQNFIHSEYKIFLAIDVAINILLNTLLQFPRGLGKNTIYAFASFLSATITIIFNVVLIAGFGLGAYGMFIATVAAKALTVVYLALYLKIWKYFSIRDFDKTVFRKVCKYSLPLVPNQLSWWVIGASDRTVITSFLGLGANGIYSVANKFSGVYSTFFSIFNLSWTESVSIHMNDPDRDRFLTETINEMFVLFASVCFGIISCMPFVFPILINEKYADAYPQIPILLVAILFQVMMGLYSTIYVALKKTVEIAKTTLYAAVINIVVDVLLIRFIGIYAGSISTLVAFAFVAIYRYIDVKKYVDVRFDKKVLFITCIVGAVSLTAYYYNILFTNVAALFIVCLYALIMNRKILLAALKMSKGVLKRK